MARKVLDRTSYTFTPSTKTIVISKYIPRERLVLITNTTTNQVIYNFSDPSLKATSYTASLSSSALDETTTIVLNYNTAAMSSTDKISILIDEYAEKFEPAETYLDPTNKLRVTTPQALIDTDFEYGTQITKWENLAMINQRPFAYPSPTQIANISQINMANASRTVQIVLSTGTLPANGTPIYVQDTYLTIANGNFVIESGGGTASATYTARAANTTAITSLLDANKTAIYQGSLYANAQIGGAPTMSYSGQQITVTTTVAHGLSIGNEINVIGVTMTAGSNAPNGTFIVTTVDSPTAFKYYVPSTLVPTGTLVATSAAIYNLPQGNFLHRAVDGGVIFSTNGSSNYEQAVRQTRRYFRYQSGKGIQISSGTLLKPTLQLDSLTSSGTTVTVQTKEKHNILPGTVITISGANEAAYNGTFTVASVTGFNTFTYTALSTPSNSIGSGGPYYVSISNWYGAVNRLGTFDQQNGLFFEYDGVSLYAVRRASTFQLSGRVTVTQGSNTVTQTSASFPTYFPRELQPGDYIVIRGQSYKVQDIASDTSMTISPSYRGASTSHANMTKTVDTRIAQSSWNLDKCDGTGPSGYNIDLGRMQMFYIDYSWYGAGYIRWGLRGKGGDVIYVHRLVNNNVNNEAYMRSGNLPARYESTTFPYITRITSSLGASDTTVSVASNAGFPTSGTLCIRDASKYEYVNYTGLSGSTAFTGLSRAGAGLTTAQTLTIASGSNSGTVTSATALRIGQRVVSNSIPEGTFITNIVGTTLTLSNAANAANPTDVLFPPMGATTGQAFTFSATAPVAVEYAYPTFAPTISHWGTSVIMDGRYDDDKSLVFTYGQNSFTALGGTSTVTLTSGSSSGTTVTVTSTSNVVVGQTVTVTAGTGSFAAGTTVASVLSATQFTVSATPSVALSGATISASGATSKALFSIRVAPSIDNGIAATFGARELINRMQLVLRALDITTSTTGANMLVTAVLNGTPSTATAWTNAVNNSTTLQNSSLAQIANYAAGNTTVSGGEVTGGFFVNSTTSIDLNTVRDLGNCILGGGGANANTNIYPDGPDVLTIVVSNLSTVAANVVGRLSWTEAQA